jgi:diaminopimelate decarboxylase
MQQAAPNHSSAVSENHLAWHSLRELEREHGGAVFILDIERFAENYRQFLNAFRCIYPNTQLAYSYKTNYIPRLCHRVGALGGYAEVVSGVEYELAVRVGTPSDRIIFNGPYKSECEIERALTSGSTLNIDTYEEADVVTSIAERHPQQVHHVGIRCNFDVDCLSASRFGLDVDGSEFAAVVTMLTRRGNIQLNGLHCHFSTGRRSADSFAKRTRKLVDVSSRCFGGLPPRFLNVGGGFFSQMPALLRGQFAFPIPTYADYAEAVASQLAKEFTALDSPQLIVEPGAALTADVMQFAARVIAVKQIRSRTVAITAGSVHNIKPTLHDKNLPMQVVAAEPRRSRRATGPLDVVGYTCMEHDCLYSNYAGVVGVDDYVVFANVGAYTVVMKPPFIRPSPAIMYVDTETGTLELLKRPETFEDMFATYVFDEWS